MGKRLIGSVGLAPGSDEGTDLTTKGDIHGYSTSNTRVPIGDNDQVLTADSSEALGLKWATPSGGGTWEELGHTTSLTTVGSYEELLISSLTVTMADYSEIVAVTHADAGGNGVGWRINGQTSDYDYWSNNVYDGSAVQVTQTSQADMLMCRYNIAPINTGIMMVAHLTRNDNYSDYIQLACICTGSAGCAMSGGILKQDTDTLTSLSVIGEGISVVAGELTIYGVKIA